MFRYVILNAAKCYIDCSKQICEKFKLMEVLI